MTRGSLMDIDISGWVWGKLPGHLRSPAWSSQKQESLFLFRTKSSPNDQSVYRLGMAWEAPSSIHWPLDPTGSCQHGWDDWGHFFYPVDLPEKGTGKHERWSAVTSKSKADNLTVFSYGWCPLQIWGVRRQSRLRTLGKRSQVILILFWYEFVVKNCRQVAPVFFSYKSSL